MAAASAFSRSTVWSNSAARSRTSRSGTRPPRRGPAADMVACEPDRHHRRRRRRTLCGGARSAAGRSRQRRGAGDECPDRARLGAEDIAAAVVKIAATVARPRAVRQAGAGGLGRCRRTRAAVDLQRAGIPHYATEADAVRGFMHLVRHREARQALMDTPPSLPADFAPDRLRRPPHCATARWPTDAPGSIRSRWPSGLRGLCDPDCRRFRRRRRTKPPPTAAASCGKGQPVVVKILSRDIVHKSDVGGVRLNLTDATMRCARRRPRSSPRARAAARGADCRRHGAADDACGQKRAN